MVARVEDCFLGKEPGPFGVSSSSHKLLSPWRWSLQGVGSDRVREPVGPSLNGSSFFDASRSGGLPTWTTSPHGHASSVGFAKGLHNVQGGGGGGGHAAVATPGSVQPHPARNNSVSDSHEKNDDSGILTSFVSSYLMAQSQAAAASAATLLQAPAGRAGVVTTTALAPGAAAQQLARNPSFESINNTGSCSTPSFCVGSPATVFPSRPSDSGGKLSPEMLLPNAAFSESRVIHASQSQLSDHYLSNDSLSYGSMEVERDAIVNCVDDFWTAGGEPLLPPEFRFEPMLDDTADTGACSGLSFSVGELDSLVSTNHGPRRTHVAGLSTSMLQPTAPASDFCQSFFAGVDDAADVKPITSSSANNKPTHIAIPARSSLLAALNATADQPGAAARLRWSDEPWMGSTSPQFSNPPSDSSKSPTGSSPSSPTTPLDPHLFASSKLTGPVTDQFNATGSNNSNKRSFATMQRSSSATEKSEAVVSLPLRLQGGGFAANADKFDAAALSALLYSNTQNNNNASYSFKETTTSGGSSAAPSAPKQRRRHGTATDPQSIAARTRREKFTDRIRVLQSLVPNGERLDTVHMLSQTFEYVRFLQHKVWDLYNGKDSLSEVKCEKWKEFVDTTTGQVLV